MNNSHNVRRLGRTVLAALCIGAMAGAFCTFAFDNIALAKNNGDHGAGHGGGNGGGNAGNGNGHAVDHGIGQQHGPSDNAAGGGDSGTDASGDTGSGDSTTASDDDESLSPHGLGKLNGFFHASPQALANASPNSSIGRLSHTFADALSAYAAAEAAQQDQQAPGDGTGTTPSGPTADQLGAILADATNKPVTPAQIRALAERLAELHPDDTALGDFAANADDAQVQKIADAANAARAGGTTGTEDDTADTTTTASE